MSGSGFEADEDVGKQKLPSLYSIQSTVSLTLESSSPVPSHNHPNVTPEIGQIFHSSAPAMPNFCNHLEYPSPPPLYKTLHGKYFHFDNGVLMVEPQGSFLIGAIFSIC